MIQSILRVIRSLRHHPLISISAVFTLAIAIAANTTIFSGINGLLLEPPPFASPDRLVVIWQTAPHDDHLPFSVPDYLDVRERSRSFASLAAYRSEWSVLGGAGASRHVDALQVTPNFFDVLGIRPSAGRIFTEREDLAQQRVALVGEHLWREMGGGPVERDATLRLHGENYRVIGVVPMDFRLPSAGSADLIVPLGTWPGITSRASHSNTVAIGRLREGVSAEAALAELKSIATDLSREYPSTNRDTGVGMAALEAELTRDFRAPLMVLWAAVTLVLLLACANVANLLLVRTESRRHDLAVQSALGASRGRIVRRLLGEAFLISATGAALGLLISVWTIDILSSLDFNRVIASRIVLDLRVALYASALALVGGLLSGAVPALRHFDGALIGRDALLAARGGSSRISRWFVSAQVGLALALTIAAALMISSFSNLIRVDPGFDPHGVVELELSLPAAQYAERPEAAGAAWLQILERTRALPGVENAALASPFPLTNSSSATSIEVEAVEDHVSVRFEVITPGYFDVLGIRLLRGRTYTDQDDPESVLMVTGEFAERFWPGEDPVGKRVRITGSGGYQAGWRSVIGVTGSIRDQGIHRAPEAMMFLLWDETGGMGFSLAVRTAGDPAAIMPAVREIVKTVEADIPLDQVRTLDELIDASAMSYRLPATLLSIFSGIALLLAALGTWAVTAWSVTRRTREIGIRMALGAGRKEIFRQLLREGLMITALGVMLGLALAVPLVLAMRSMLFGVEPGDPQVAISVAAILLVSVLTAVALPAHRATRVDPNVALREE